MAGRNKIDEAYIDIKGDISGLKGSVQEGKKEVQDLGDEADKAGGRVNKSFTKAGEGIEKSTEGARKFVGALSSVAGIATGLIGVVGLLTGAFIALTEVIKKLNSKGEDGLVKTRENLKSVFDEISGANAASKKFPVFDDLNDEIEKLSEQLNDVKMRINDTDRFENLYAGLAEKYRELEQRLVDLRRQRQQLLEQSREIGEQEKGYGDEAVERYRKLQEAQGQFLDQLKQQNQLDSINLLPEDKLREQIRETADFMEEQFMRAAEAVGLDIDDEAVRKRIGIIRTEEQIKLNALDERIAKERKADQEREAEKDRRSQERIAREIEQLSRGLDGIFNAEFTTRLDSLVQVLREGNNAIGRLK